MAPHYLGTAKDQSVIESYGDYVFRCILRCVPARSFEEFRSHKKSRVRT